LLVSRGQETSASANGDKQTVFTADAPTFYLHENDVIIWYGPQLARLVLDPLDSFQPPRCFLD
jgi:hypothetical protein